MNKFSVRSNSIKAVLMTCFALAVTSCGSSNNAPLPIPGGPGGGFGGGSCTGPGGTVPPQGLNVGFSIPQVTAPQWNSFLGTYSSNWWLSFSSQALAGAVFQTAWAVGHDVSGTRVYLNVTGLPINGGPVVGPIGVNGTVSLSASHVEYVKAASGYNYQNQQQYQNPGQGYGYQAQPLCVTNVQFQGGITPSFTGGTFYTGYFYLQWNYNGFDSSVGVLNGP